MWDNPFAGEWEMQNRVSDARRQVAQNRELYASEEPTKAPTWWSLTMLTLGSLFGFVISKLGLV
jgi:hypothetical protein